MHKMRVLNKHIYSINNMLSVPLTYYIYIYKWSVQSLRWPKIWYFPARMLPPHTIHIISERLTLPGSNQYMEMRPTHNSKSARRDSAAQKTGACSCSRISRPGSRPDFFSIPLSACLDAWIEYDIDYGYVISDKNWG